MSVERLTFFDESGKGRLTLGVDRTKTPGGKTVSYPESSILLFNPEGNVSWSAP